MVEFILYVSNQQSSRDFYSRLLKKPPELDVSGMTEYELAPGVKLGLMPEKGIEKLLGDTMPAASGGSGVPRCELYLKVEDIDIACHQAISAGARLLRETALMDWGDQVCYLADPDGHIIALAQPLLPGN